MNLTDFNIPLIFWVSFMMAVWFESDIVQTIANLTNTRNLLKINEFVKHKLEIDVMSNYPDFLYTTRPGYITKLLSCPICLCFWSTLVTSNILVYGLGYSQFYGLLIFPINYISSLTIYLIIRKLL
jgi:hypothetical protein